MRDWMFLMPFLFIVVVALGGIYLGWRYNRFLNELYKEPKRPGEFENMVSLKASESVKNFYGFSLVGFYAILVLIPENMIDFFWLRTGLSLVFAFGFLFERLMKRKTSQSYLGRSA